MIGNQGEAARRHALNREGGWGLVCVANDGSLNPVALHDGAIVGAYGDQSIIGLGEANLAARHAQFHVRPEGVFIADLQTEMGTRVDGLPVSMLGLAHGSVVRLGDVLALFVERDLDTYAGVASLIGGEMLVGSRQRVWVDSAIGQVRARQNVIIQGGLGAGKATLARVAIRESGVPLPVHTIDGAGLDPEQLLRSYDMSGPVLWFIQHIDRVPRAAQSDLVRAIRAMQGSTLIGTIVGAIEDAQAEGRVGASLMGLVEGRVIGVPALEQRREDVPALSMEMLRRMGIRLVEGMEGVFEAVLRAGWPGGVRELGAHLAAAFDVGGTAQEAARILRRSVPRAPQKSPLSLQESDADLARARLRRALDHASGTVAVAARELRMSRQAFYRELRRLDMDGKRRTHTAS